MNIVLKIGIFKKIKVLIVTEKFGDLGNRLCRFARLFSVTQQEGAYLLDLSLFQYSYLYAPKNIVVSFLFKGLQLLNNDRLKKLEKYLSCSNDITSSKLNFYPETGKPLPSSEIKKEIQESSKAILLLTKNSYYLNGSEVNTKKKLLKIFVLKKSYLQEAKKLIAKITANADESLVVAVHIRQGEYKNFADGIYYFEEEVYAASMRNLLLTCENKKQPLRFILITKEDIRLEAFHGLPFHFFGSQSVAVDQALLQQSDYIISTTSTFSAWPSFLHNIPQGVIVNKAIPLNWDDFKVADLNFNGV